MPSYDGIDQQSPRRISLPSPWKPQRPDGSATPSSSPRHRGQKRRISAADRVKQGSPRVELSPLRMSMDHSDTIPGYDPVARHGRSLSRYSTTSSRATSRSPRSSPLSRRSRQQNPLEIIKLLQEHNDRKGGNSNDIINIFNAMDVGEKEEKRLGGSSSVTPSADPVSPLTKKDLGTMPWASVN